jgi:hypothetical protein
MYYHHGTDSGDWNSRSLGASKFFIVTLIMKESILLCVGGSGYLWQFLLYVAKSFFPTLAFDKLPMDGGAALSAGAGVIDPSIRAEGGQPDPVEAFATIGTHAA